jgi:hypothetical protein
MLKLAHEAELPVDDIEHLRDLGHLLLLARRYYFEPFNESLAAEIRAAKKAYKQSWPATTRQRYRVKISFRPLPFRRRTLALAAAILLRRRRAYRLFDRLVTLRLAGVAWRALRPRDPAAMPKFLRKSAMGVDALFK